MLDADAIIGAALKKTIMWENGTQPIWKGLANSLNVQYSSQIAKIVRDASGVHIYFTDGRAPLFFDKVILAIDPLEALRILDATPSERDIYSNVKHMPYSTFAVRVNGLSEGRSEVGYLRENMTTTRVGHPMAWIKRYADDNVFVFHLYAPNGLSDHQILENIRQDMGRLGGKDFQLLDSRRWPFFPHVDAAAMREGQFFARATNIQGLNNTVFVNEVLGMSTMPDAAAVGKKAAERLSSGNY